MPVVRWLLSIVAVLALAGQAATAYASAGVKTDIRCCCPDPETCKCHDHDGKGPDTEQLGRCAGGVHVDGVMSIVSLPAAPAPALTTAVREVPPPYRTLAIPEDRTFVPEKPPF